MGQDTPTFVLSNAITRTKTTISILSFMTNTSFRFTFLACLLFCSSLFCPIFNHAQTAVEPSEKQLADLDKLMAPYRKKVVGILEADKTGQYKKYVADLNTLAKTEDAATHVRLEAKLKRDHYQFIKNAYAKAVINHEEMKKGVAKILGHNKFTIDEFGGLNVDILIPPLKLPVKVDATLTAPYETSQHESNAAIAGLACSSTSTTTSMRVSSGALFDGGCRSKGSLGNKFDLPSGNFSKITLAAQFNFHARGMAYAVGYSYVKASIGLRLQGPGVDKKVIVREHWRVAPLVWYSSFDETINNFVAQNTFTGTFAGGNTFTAQVYNETFAIAVSPLTASSKTIIDSEAIDFIKVTASN